MNLSKRLRHLADKLSNPREYGKTTMIAKMTKEIDGIMLVHNVEEASRVNRQYGVVAKSIDVNLDNLSGPFFLDNQAAMRLLQRAADKIEALEQQIEEFMKEGESNEVAKNP